MNEFETIPQRAIALELAGLLSFRVKAVSSYPDEALEIQYLDLLGDCSDPEIRGSSGVVKYLSRDGEVVCSRSFTFKRWELLPFNFDYSSSGPSYKSVMLRGVSYGEPVPA